MRGYIRRRGEHSYEYIVDIGTAAAQRCQSLQAPLLGRAQAQGVLPEVRRRASRDRGAPPRDQGRLRHAQGVRGRSRQGAGRPGGPDLHGRPPGSRSRRSCSAEWLPTVKGSLRPTTYASYDDARPRAHHPASRWPAAAEAQPGGDQRPLRPSARTRPRPRRRAAVCFLGTPRARRPAPRLSRRRALGPPDASTRSMPPIRPRQAPSITRGCRSGAPSSWPPSLPQWPTIASTPSGDCWP